jgi:hypothetical protein
LGRRASEASVLNHGDHDAHAGKQARIEGHE